MTSLPAFAPLLQEYMPHGMCYLWQSDLVWLHVISDIVITLAYWAIPFALVWFVMRARREVPAGEEHGSLPYAWMFLAFGIFIVACGATHAMGIWTIWEPRYWLEGGVKAVTAAASIATAIALPPLVPRAIELLKDARESERRRRELERAHRELADAHRELEELYEKVREADRAKSEFLAAVSHELRTPITLVLGPAERGLEAAEPDDEDRERYAVIRRNALQLSSRVDDLLQVARLETGSLALSYARADAAGLVRGVAEHFREALEAAGLEMALDLPATLPAEIDPGKTERIVFNLFANALKFTPDGGRIRCSLFAEPGDGNRGEGTIVVEVADSGPGVPEEVRESIFERFRQSEGTAERSYGGVGLGLALSRELAELQEGTLAVEDAPEGGALFRLRLPRRAPAAAVTEETDGPRSWLSSADAVGALLAAETGAPPRPTRSEPSPTGGPPEGDEAAGAHASAGDDGGDPDRPELLIVEDNRDLNRFLRESLGDDFRIRSAYDGREGLEAILSSPPDIVLADLMMPEFGGERMIRELREEHGMADLPVIVLTALAEDETAARLLRSGATDFVRKPVALPELRARLDNRLAVHQALQVLRRELAEVAPASEGGGRGDAPGATDGERSDLVVLTRALAGRKQELQEALERNQLLLQEVHHRVRGNLQLIESLVQMQIRRHGSPEARRALERLRNRISSMTLVHRLLYRSDGSGRVDLASLLRELVGEVVRSQQGADGAVECQLDLEETMVGAGDAVACGIAVQELVSNALEHGFPDSAGGTVTVDCRRDEAGAVILSVSDTGVGYAPEARDLGGREDDGVGLGLAIVDALVTQLDGSLEYRSPDGEGSRAVIRYVPTDHEREEVA